MKKYSGVVFIWISDMWKKTVVKSFFYLSKQRVGRKTDSDYQ